MVGRTSLDQVKDSFKKDSDRINVRDHICSIIAKFLEERPNRAFEAFEALSVYVKENKFYGPPAPDTALIEEVDCPKRQQWIDSVSAFMDLTAPHKSSLARYDCAFPNILQEFEMLKWAGIGFSQSEGYHISLSLRKLSTTEGLKRIRLWGKILGTEADYLVAEGVLEGRGAVDSQFPNREPRGVGINAFTYWVARDAFSDWVQLPDARPEHFATARQIKKFFTGDLERYVISHPWFPGQEKHLLRCQIARITAGTSIAPAGFYAMDEEGVEYVPQDYTLPALGAGNELATPEGWVHSAKAVLANGCTTYPEVEAEDNEELFKEIEALRESDPPPEPLRSIAEDTPAPRHEAAWTIRTLGDPTSYNFGDETKAYGVVVARSNLWPGAITVAQNGVGHVGIYVGYGFKEGSPAFVPLVPRDMMTEPVDLPEYPEPYPAENDVISEGGSQASEPED